MRPEIISGTEFATVLPEAMHPRTGGEQTRKEDGMSGVGPLAPGGGLQEMMAVKDKESLAEQLKDLRKLRMQRETIGDPSKIGKLLVAETTLLYNSNAEIVQMAGSLE
jgi:hypothetical protein